MYATYTDLLAVHCLGCLYVYNVVLIEWSRHKLFLEILKLLESKLSLITLRAVLGGHQDMGPGEHDYMVKVNRTLSHITANMERMAAKLLELEEIRSRRETAYDY